MAAAPRQTSLHGSAYLLGQPGSSSSQGQVGKDEEVEDKDVVDLLDKNETLELMQFDPSVGALKHGLLKLLVYKK